MWLRILALIMKELTSLWADKKTRYVLLIPPLIQVVIFANAANYDVRQVPLSVWNEDIGAQALDYVRGYSFSNAFAPGPKVLNPAQAEAALDSKQAAAVLHIPQNFSADILAGRPASVQLLLDARRSNTALLIANYAAEITAAYDARLPNTASAPVDIEITNLLNPALESKWFILPGLVVILSLIMTMLVSALSLARERELGTYEQMLITPLRPAEIMVGKAIPALIVGMVEANIVLVAAVLFFQLPFKGDIFILEACLAVFCLAGVGVGLAISSIAQTQQQAILGVFIYASPAIVISGYASPIENMPPPLQWLSLLSPIRYMLVLTRGMFLENLPLNVVIQQTYPIVLIGFGLLSIAVLSVRRTL